MAVLDNLSWIATVDKDWISVSPTAGTGSQNISIEVDPATSFSDEVYGVVTFSCVDCGYTVIKKINISRCACEEKSVSTTYSSTAVTVEKCADNVEVELPYEEDIEYTQGCLPVHNTGVKNVTFNFFPNNTSQEKIYTFYYPENRPSGYATITVTQLAGPCKCTESTCTCYLVSDATAPTVSSAATSANVSWNYTAITWTTLADCTSSSSVTTGNSSQIVTFNKSTCDNNTKSGSFIWAGHKACLNGSCSNNDIYVNWSITQEKPSGCECSCDDLSVEGYTLSANERLISTVIGEYATNDCFSVSSRVSKISGDDSFLGFVECRTNGTIVASSVSKNENAQRSVTYRITGHSNTSPSFTCKKEFTVTQEGSSTPTDPCDGKTIAISPENVIFSCSGGTINFTVDEPVPGPCENRTIRITPQNETINCTGGTINFSKEVS